MTEGEWLTSTDPAAMLRGLELPLELPQGRSRFPSDRKLRLFACACCRQARDSMGKVVDYKMYEKRGPHKTELEWAVMWADPNAKYLAQPAKAALLRDIIGNPFRPVTLCPSRLEERAGGALVHVFDCPDPDEGYHAPHCPLINQTVLRVATTICEERRFDDLPILADALEDAGCDNKDILWHCRNEGPWYGHVWVKEPPPHVRGCWVLDLLLGQS